VKSANQHYERDRLGLTAGTPRHGVGRLHTVDQLSDSDMDGSRDSRGRLLSPWSLRQAREHAGRGQGLAFLEGAQYLRRSGRGSHVGRRGVFGFGIEFATRRGTVEAGVAIRGTDH